MKEDEGLKPGDVPVHYPGINAGVSQGPVSEMRITNFVLPACLLEKYGGHCRAELKSSSFRK